jgi:hypothetical protein
MPISTVNQAGLNAPLTLTSPVLTTPNLGTPSAINLTNAVFPAGCVLQVVNAAYSTTTTSASSTFADTGLTASITPKFATSKILVHFTLNGCRKFSSDTVMFIQLVRNSTVITKIEGIAGYTASTANSTWGTSGCTYLDSPATTSSTTYKPQLASSSNTSGVRINEYLTNAGDSVSFITLMEIAA